MTESNVAAPAFTSDPERRLRLGFAVTYIGPNGEGSLSFEQTVSGVGGRIPVTSVFRIVMRTSHWPF